MISSTGTTSIEPTQSDPPKLVQSVHHALSSVNTIVEEQVESIIKRGEKDSVIVHAEQEIGRSYGYSYGEVATKAKRWRIWVEKAELQREDDNKVSALAERTRALLVLLQMSLTYVSRASPVLERVTCPWS